MNVLNRIKELTSTPHSRAIAVGILVLAILAVLQVNQMHRTAPMCPLLENCQLSASDMERMEFALGKSGLNEFRVEDGELLVPQRLHGSYLKAIADQNAIPSHLRDDEPVVPSINPFMSRSQQRLIAENEKKRQIREMVSRLPFVDQAWFEMDAVAGGSAFEPDVQSAVISVRPPSGVLLDVHQVTTLRQMIGGALAGIDPADIVVIDVSAGYAHQSGNTATQFNPVSISQRPVLEQKSYYTNQIRQALSNYGDEYADVEVDVQIDLFEVTAPVQHASFARPEKSEISSRANVIGTNGAASIYDTPVEVQPTLQTATPTPQQRFDSRVRVAMSVPQKIVDGLPNTFVVPSPTGQSNPSPTPQAKFERLRRELVDVVRPVLPASSFQQESPFPVSISMIRKPTVVATSWQTAVATFFKKHWPSMAVLGIGLVLLTLMTRNQVPETVASEVANAQTQDIVSIASTQPQVGMAEDTRIPRPDAALAQPEDYAKRDAERKLNQLFEQDPDSAVKVIESWIRDAA